MGKFRNWGIEGGVGSFSHQRWLLNNRRNDQRMAKVTGDKPEHNFRTKATPEKHVKGAHLQTALAAHRDSVEVLRRKGILPRHQEHKGSAREGWHD